MLLDRRFPFFDVDKTLEEIDRMFGGARLPLSLRSVPRGTFPAVNIYDYGNSVVLTAEIPGVNSEDLELTVLNNSVTLKGQRRDGTQGDDHFHRQERPTGDFTRTLTLQYPVDSDSVKAEYKNGILRVTMEKAEQAKVKKIEIKS